MTGTATAASDDSSRMRKEKAPRYQGAFREQSTDGASGAGQRRQADLDASDRGATFGRGVGSDRLSLAHADDGEAATVNALSGQVARHGRSAALRKLHIVLIVAGRIRMAVNIDQRLLVFLQNESDGIQRRIESRHD